MSIDNEKHTELARMYQHVSNGGLSVSIERVDYDLTTCAGTKRRTGLSMNVSLSNHGVPMGVKVPVSRAILNGWKAVIDAALEQCEEDNQFHYLGSGLNYAEVTVAGADTVYDSQGTRPPHEYSSGPICAASTANESPAVEDEGDEDGGDSIDNKEG